MTDPSNPSDPPHERSVSPVSSVPGFASTEASSSNPPSTAATASSTPFIGPVHHPDPGHDQHAALAPAVLNADDLADGPDTDHAFVDQVEEVENHKFLLRVVEERPPPPLDTRFHLPPHFADTRNLDRLDMAELHRIEADVMFARYYYDDDEEGEAGGWVSSATLANRPNRDTATENDAKSESESDSDKEQDQTVDSGRTPTSALASRPAQAGRTQNNHTENNHTEHNHTQSNDSPIDSDIPAGVMTGFGGMAIRDPTRPSTVPNVHHESSVEGAGTGYSMRTDSLPGPFHTITVSEHHSAIPAILHVHEPIPNPIFPPSWATHPHTRQTRRVFVQVPGRSWQEEDGNYTTDNRRITDDEDSTKHDT